MHGTSHPAKSQHGYGYGYGYGNFTSGPIEKSASDIGDSAGSQRECFAVDGDTGGESSRDAARAGEWNLEYRGDLERERNCGRKHGVWADLRRGFESLPDGDEHQHAAGGSPCAEGNSLSESGERGSSERGGFHEERKRANHGDQSRAGVRATRKRHTVATSCAGLHRDGAGNRQPERTYKIDGLAVGHSYTVYAEALNAAVDPSQFENAIVSLCRNTVSDPGWPPLDRKSVV